MNLHARTPQGAALAAVLGLLAACGGTVESGQVDSGLPKDQPVAELTAEEGQALCKAMFQAANERIAEMDMCAVIAFDHAADSLRDVEEIRQDCSASYAACAEGSEPEDYLHDLDTLDCPTSSNPCAATVAEVEACWTDEVEQGIQPAQADCDTMTDADIEAYFDRLTGPFEVSPACETLYAKCSDGFHP